MYNILLIDDNQEILEMNASHFLMQDFSVFSADTGIKALSLLNEKKDFDCIVLDIMLPDLDGFTICKAIRTITDTPIIFSTCMDDLDNKIKGFIAGGDDYLTKPYSLKELSARVFALIRRAQIKPVRNSADFYIDHENRMIHTNGKNIFLSQKEYELFMLFYKNPQTIFSKKELLEKIWLDITHDHNNVAVYISKLRHKISFAQETIGYIECSYRKGYRFIPANKL